MKITVDVSATALETERLTLRPFRPEDLNDFFAYASVPGVGEAAGWNHHQSVRETQVILDSFINDKNVFAVCYKETGKVIGSLGFHAFSYANKDEYKGLRIIEIGYVLSKSFWGQGLMTEAVAKAIDYCFSELKLDAVACSHFTENDRSRRVIEKSGFKFTGKGTYYSRQMDKTFEDVNYILHKIP